MALTARLREILKIRAPETRMVGLLTGLTFCASAGGALGSPGVEALFFARFGVQFLPHMYIALGLVIAATSLGITALLARVDRQRLYVGLPLALACVLVVARLLVMFDPLWFYPPLWLGMNVFWTLLGLFTWGLAGLVCDTRQAKRLFPLFSAGGILGLTVGGLVTVPLVEALGTENLLLVWAATLGLAFWLSHTIARSYGRGRGQRSAFRPPPPLFQAVRQGYQFARGSTLIRWMSYAAVLFAVLYYSVVFPFSKAAAAEFLNEDALAAFLGVFSGLSMGAALVTSLFLASRLYARLGFMSTILAYPLLYFIGFAALTLSAAFPVLVAFRFAQLVWSEGVSEGANQAMYNLVPSDRREQTRAFVRGVANPAGVTLVGGILLASQQALPTEAMYVIGIAAAAATTGLVWQARRAYRQALVEALRAGQPQLFFSEEEPFGGFPRDATAVAAAVAGITSRDVVVRRVSAEILSYVGPRQAVREMLAALKDEDAAVRAALLRALARAGAGTALPAVVSMLHDPDSHVRLEAVLALRALAASPSNFAEDLQTRLRDPDPSVRSQAAVSLVRAGPHPAAEQVIRGMAADGDIPTRVEALTALAEWRSQQAYDIAARNLSDPQPAIRRAAAQVMVRIDARQCILPLIERLGDEDPSVCRAAAAALGNAGLPALEPVLGALTDPRLEAGALVALQHFPPSAMRPTVLAYARSRTAKAMYYHDLWLASQASAGRDESLLLLADSLRNQALFFGTNALRALALLGDAAAISLAMANLDSPDPAQRANAVETLDSLAERQVVQPLLALWESPEARPPAADHWLVQVLRDEDAWLRANAALAVKEAGDPQAWAELARMEDDDPDELVRATTRQVRLGESVMKTLPTLSLMERIVFLRRVPLFADLPPADLKSIAGIAGEHLFGDGEVIAAQGEIGEELFIIVSGVVRVVARDAAGDEEEIARRLPGDFVGEVSVLSQKPRMASLIAVGDTRALCIERVEFEEILRLRPETSLAVMRVLCDRLRERI